MAMIDRQKPVLDTSFKQLLLQHHRNLVEASPRVSVTGDTLTLAAVVSLARNHKSCFVDQKALRSAGKSASIIRQSLKDGHIIYGELLKATTVGLAYLRSGVNTGFGGSAGTRTQAVEDIQRLLMRGLHYGVMSEPSNRQLEDELSAPCMPETWARASMAIRLNSLVSGSSGVGEETIETLQKMLNANIVPRIPLRGSISASGDLSPLSYIGGAMQGKSSISVFFGDRSKGRSSIVPAHKALRESGISPITLQAKEGLAITNGTAVSTGVAALALHESLFLYAMAQVLTAMSVEALNGTDESFDPYFAQVRPHPGQRESAHLILDFLSDSKLVARNANLEEASLRQDRYSIRTAPQWTGPMAEDLQLAFTQITTEINSVTDNPLIDPVTSRVLHGGNFQAKSVTTACDKLRLVLQTLGRMLSVQCTEMINPATNRGLPPNLVVDEPSQSFIWKGTDILVAALTSELGFLANPVGTHVQTAEMGNQALNSLALISARYTHEAVACLSQLVAAHLVALCQALDLRVMHIKFLEVFKPKFLALIPKVCVLSASDHANRIVENVWWSFCKNLENSTSMDSTKRFMFCVESLMPIMVKAGVLDLFSLAHLQKWTEECAEQARQDYLDQVELVASHADATPFLGKATKRMYQYVRTELNIPFIREKTISTPDSEATNGSAEEQAQKANKMGDYITKVHDGLRRGSCHDVIAEIFADVPDLQEQKDMMTLKRSTRLFSFGSSVVPS